MEGVAGRRPGVVSVKRRAATTGLASSKRALCLFLAGGGSELAIKSTVVAVAVEADVEVDTAMVVAVGGHGRDYGRRVDRDVRRTENQHDKNSEAQKRFSK